MIKLFSLLQMRSEEKIQIEQSSPEWNQALYQIQLATGQPAVKLINLFKYPTQLDHSSDDASIKAMVDATDLKSNFTSMIIDKSIPLQDVIFICGHINLQNYHNEASKVFHFLLCQLALGSAAPFVQGFEYADALLIEPDKPDDPFHYNVFVKAYQQYQVKYQCTFVLGDQNQVKKQPVICTLCGTKNATIYCKDQQKHFCENCSAAQHAPPLEKKKTQQLPPQHQMQPVNRTNSLPLCMNHGIRNEFYCSTCEQYLCPACTQQPAHYQNSQHTIRPIEFLYSEKRQTNTRLQLKPKQKLKKLLEIAKEKRKVLVGNFQKVKDQIQAEIERAVAELQNIYRERLLMIESDIIQIQMELDRLNWNHSFLKIQEEQLKPIYYFKIQSKVQDDMSNSKVRAFNAADIQSDIHHYTIIRIGDKQTIEDLKKEPDPAHQRKSSQSKFDALRREDRQSNEQMKKLGDRLLRYDEGSDPPQRGELSLLLQNSGVHFFKVKHITQ